MARLFYFPVWLCNFILPFFAESQSMSSASSSATMKGYSEEEEMLDIGTFQRREQNHPYQQSQTYVDEFPARPARDTPTPRGNRPNSYSRPNSSLYADEFVSPGWPPSIAGRSEAQTLVDSAAGSRASLRSWKTGHQTPVDSSISPRYGIPFHADSGPSTPMVSRQRVT